LSCAAFDFASCHNVHLVPIEISTISQLQIQSMIWASTLQIRKHEYFGDLEFIILFVGILPLYATSVLTCAMHGW